jgi:hypothetical protein
VYLWSRASYACSLGCVVGAPHPHPHPHLQHISIATNTYPHRSKTPIVCRWIAVQPTRSDTCASEFDGSSLCKHMYPNTPAQCTRSHPDCDPGLHPNPNRFPCLSSCMTLECGVQCKYAFATRIERTGSGRDQHTERGFCVTVNPLHPGMQAIIPLHAVSHPTAKCRPCARCVCTTNGRWSNSKHHRRAKSGLVT